LPTLKTRLARFFQSSPAEPLTLSKARCGERLRVVGVKSTSPECIRLKEMGFCESVEVCKVVDGNALICQMRGVRLAIARSLGADVVVEPMRSTGSTGSIESTGAPLSKATPTSRA